MTVADLIALLNDMPADARVLVNDGAFGRSTPIIELDDGDVVFAID
jgi:hypothetical protein